MGTLTLAGGRKWVFLCSPELVKELEQAELRAAHTALQSNDVATLKKAGLIDPSEVLAKLSRSWFMRKAPMQRGLRGAASEVGDKSRRDCRSRSCE